MISELRQKYDLNTLLKIAGMARSTFYYTIKTMKQPDKNAGLKNIIKTIFEQNKARYGYRRITLELHNRGYCVNHKTVLKLMNELGLYCKVRRKKYNSYRGESGEAAPNLIKRDFHADDPQKKWTTDVTEFALLGQKVYLSPILDMYNSEIISYTISMRPNYTMVKSMLCKAFAAVGETEGIIFHSDQGWQYRMMDYQNTLKEHGIIQSMSRKGNCLDNSIMENFFGMLKSEMFYGEYFKSIEDFIEKLEDYIYYYNNYRIKAKLNGLSPIQYRNQSTNVA